MIKPGKIVIIGDEFFDLIASSAGVDSYIFDGSCGRLLDWISSNIELYDVIIYFDTIINKCKDVDEFLKKKIHEKILLPIEYPAGGVFKDPRDYYREFVRRVLGVEIIL